MCHHPSIGQYTENCSLCTGIDDDAGNAVRLPPVCRVYLYAGYHYGSCSGSPGWSNHGFLGILQSMLGFDESAQALMIALYIAMDSFGTACNVTGDGAIALIIDKIMGKTVLNDCAEK